MLRGLLIVLILLPSAAIAAEFHRVLSAVNPEKYHDHARITDYLVRGEDVYLALSSGGAAGIHGYAGYRPRLVGLSPDGTVLWERYYESIDSGSPRLVATNQGLYMLVVHSPRHGSSFGELDIWRLSEAGELVGKIAHLEGNDTFKTAHSAGDGVDVMYISRWSDPKSLRLVRLNAEGKTVSDRQVPVEARSMSVTSDSVYVLTRKHRLVRLSRTGETIDEDAAPPWAARVAANDRGEVYFLGDIRQPDLFEPYQPVFELRLLYRNGDTSREYHALHRIAPSRLHLDDEGSLWITGHTEPFGAVLRFKDGKLVDKFRFTSRLEDTTVTDIEELETGELLVIGRSETRFRPERYTDAVVLRAKPQGDLLKLFQRCVANPDRILTLERFLKERAGIYPAYQDSRARPFMKAKATSDAPLASPYYSTLPPRNDYLPAPDQCSGSLRDSYLAFLERLAAYIEEHPIGHFDKALIIRMTVRDSESANGTTLGSATRRGVGLIASVDQDPSSVMQVLTTEVYPWVDQSFAVRLRLYREAGILLNTGRGGDLGLRDVMLLNQELESSWLALTVDERRTLEAGWQTIVLELDPAGLVTTREGATVAISRVLRHLLDDVLPAKRLARDEEVKAWVAEHRHEALPADYLMQQAVQHNWPNLLSFALASNANIETTACYGQRMLLVAAKENHADVARVLIEHGANVNALGANHETALHIALGERSVAVVRLLLGTPGLDLAIQDSSGRTALDVANAKRHTLPEWVFEELAARDAPATGKTTRGSWIIVPGGSSCGREDADLPTVIIE